MSIVFPTWYQERLEIKDSHSSLSEGSGTNHCCGTFISGMLHFTQLQVTEEKPLPVFCHCHRVGNPVSLPSCQAALTASFPVQFSPFFLLSPVSLHSFYISLWYCTPGKGSTETLLSRVMHSMSKATPPSSLCTCGWTEVQA